MAIGGGEDNRWPSTPQARAIQTRLHVDDAEATIELLTYPAAGHGVATYPFQPAGVMGVHPVDGRTYHHGGTRAANAAARRDSWSRVLLSSRPCPSRPVTSGRLEVAAGQADQPGRDERDRGLDRLMEVVFQGFIAEDQSEGKTVRRQGVGGTTYRARVVVNLTER